METTGQIFVLKHDVFNELPNCISFPKELLKVIQAGYVVNMAGPISDGVAIKKGIKFDPGEILCALTLQNMAQQRIEVEVFERFTFITVPDVQVGGIQRLLGIEPEIPFRQRTR